MKKLHISLTNRKLTFFYKNILRIGDRFMQFPIFAPNKLM